MEITNTQTTSTARTLLSCFRKVAFAVALVILACLIVAWCIDHRAEIWRTTFNILTFGGHFWPSVVSATALLALAVWAACAALNLETAEGEAKPRAVGLLGFLAFLGGVGYVAGYAAMQQAFPAFDALNIYAQVSVVALSLPLIPAVLAVCALALAGIDLGGEEVEAE